MTLARLLAVAFGLALLVLFVQNRRENRVLPPSPDGGIPLVPTAMENPAAERAKWVVRIRAIGPDEAYAEFKRTYAESPFNVQHRAAHLMGEALYETQGTTGFGSCDDAFSFGCYHSFFARAIGERGVADVPKLDAACVQKFGKNSTGCEHGIGHGILEYLGHDKLVAALNTCLSTTQLNPLFGCTSGVFMEYNMPTIIGEETQARIRKLNPSNPYEPCNTAVPLRFRESCYYEIAEWWSHVLGRDFQKMAALCGAVPGTAERRDCYLGLGNTAAFSSGYTVEGTIERCNAVENKEDQIICRIGAFWRFHGMNDRVSLITELCRDSDPAFETKCRENSQKIR